MHSGGQCRGHGRTYGWTAVKNQGSGTIYAAARVRHRGRSTALVSVEITGDNHRLLAVAEFTMFCVGSGVTEERA